MDTISVLTIIIGTILPILVALVTTRVTSSAVKAWLLTTFTLVSTVLQSLLASHVSGIPFELGAILLTAIQQFIVSIAIYYGLWKPTGIAGAVQDVGSRQ